jgi:hypothetical protein
MQSKIIKPEADNIARIGTIKANEEHYDARRRKAQAP